MKRGRSRESVSAGWSIGVLEWAADDLSIRVRSSPLESEKRGSNRPRRRYRPRSGTGGAAVGGDAPHRLSWSVRPTPELRVILSLAPAGRRGRRGNRGFGRDERRHFPTVPAGTFRF
jgi:hypothetical protein